jgi:hypothetical protein
MWAFGLLVGALDTLDALVVVDVGVDVDVDVREGPIGGSIGSVCSDPCQCGERLGEV